MDIVIKLFWKQPLYLSEVLPITDIVVNIPFGTMIVDPTLSVPVTSVNGLIGNVVLTAADVGAATESYVDTEITTLQTTLQTSINTKANTSYVDTQDGLLQTAINTKADAALVTQALSTKADLVNGVVPSNQLPSYVDDVLEYVDLASFPVTGEASKIYIAIDTNKTYRWSSTQYVEIGGGGVALGETSATAYRGDRGKIAYDHSLSQGNPHNTTTSDITEGTNKYFTDLRVRNTVLSGLVKTDSSNVTNTDTIEVAVGKLAANSEAGGAVITWIPASTIGNAVTGFDVSLFEFAKINDMLFCRGFVKVNSTLASGNPCFSITNNSYKIIRPLTTASKTFTAGFSILNGASTAQGLRFMVTGNSIDETSALTSIQALEPVTNIAANSEYFAVPPNTCLGQLVTP